MLMSLIPCHAQAEPREETAARPETLALIDVQVVTMESEAIAEHRTVLIREGRIAEIGPAGVLKVPRGASRIEAGGKYLMPGLIDCFCHVDGVVSLLPYVANGVTTIRNTAGGYTTHLGIRDGVARGELFGPTILTTGGDITGIPPNFNSQEPVTNPDQAARVVAEVKRLGFDGVMVYSRIGGEVQQAVAAAARRLDFPVTGHASLNQKLSETARSGQRSVENLIGMVRLSTGEIGYSDEVAQQAGRTLREAGVYCIPTLTVRQVRSGKHLAQANELDYFAPSQRGGISEDSRLNVSGYRYEGAPKMVSILHKEGVKILLGTDAGYPGVLPGFALHGPFGELHNLVGAGLAPYEVIRAGTRDAAEFLRLLDQLGTVTVGKRADLILVEGNPLVDVGNVAHIAGVVLRGRWLSKADLQARLVNQAESFRRPPQRFARLQPLPSEGEEEFAGHYTIRQGTLVIGEERLVIHRLANGRRALDSQASIDPYFDTRTTLHVEIGADSRSDLVELRRDATDGTTALRMWRSEGQARISGARPYYGEIKIDEPIQPETFLGGPILANDLDSDMVATYALAAGSLSGLEIGKSVDLHLKQLELNPDAHFRNATIADRTWVVLRKEDEASTTNEERRERRGYRSYEITMAGRGGFGSYKTRLIVDDQQHPWRIVIQTDGGENIFQRV